MLAIVVGGVPSPLYGAFGKHEGSSGCARSRLYSLLDAIAGIDCAGPFRPMPTGSLGAVEVTFCVEKDTGVA